MGPRTKREAGHRRVSFDSIPLRIVEARAKTPCPFDRPTAAHCRSPGKKQPASSFSARPTSPKGCPTPRVIVGKTRGSSERGPSCLRFRGGNAETAPGERPIAGSIEDYNIPRDELPHESSKFETNLTFLPTSYLFHAGLHLRLG